MELARKLIGRLPVSGPPFPVELIYPPINLCAKGQLFGIDLRFSLIEASMEFLGLVLVILGYIAFIAGWVWGLRLAFREGSGFGAVCLFVPMVLIYFLTTKSIRTWPPFLLFVSGLVMFMYGTKLW